MSINSIKWLFVIIFFALSVLTFGQERWPETSFEINGCKTGDSVRKVLNSFVQAGFSVVSEDADLWGRREVTMRKSGAKFLSGRIIDVELDFTTKNSSLYRIFIKFNETEVNKDFLRDVEELYEQSKSWKSDSVASRWFEPAKNPVFGYSYIEILNKRLYWND